MGKGTLLTLFAYGIYIIGTYFLHVVLARLLGPGSYGTFVIVLSLLSISDIFVFRGMLDTVSKHVAEDPLRSYSLSRSVTPIHILFSLAMATVYFCAANPLSVVLHDQKLAPLIRLSSLSIVPWGLLSIYLGILEGRREFGKKSVVLLSNTIFKLLFIIGLVQLGYSTKGAVLGYTLSIIPSIFIVYFLCSVKKNDYHVSLKPIVSFAVSLIGANLLFSLIQYADIVFVQYFLSDGVKTGYYSAAATIAKTIPIVFVSFNSTLQPSVSLAFTSKDRSQEENYVFLSFRFALLLLVPTIAVLASQSEGILALLYTTKFSGGAGALRILAVGTGFQVFVNLFCSILTGRGKPRLQIVLGATVLIVDVCSSILLIPRFGLLGAAAAFSVASFSGAIFSAVYLHKNYRGVIRRTGTWKTLLAGAIVYVAGMYWRSTGLAVIPLCAALYSVFVLVLFGIKGIGREDFQTITGALKRRPGQPTEQ